MTERDRFHEEPLNRLQLSTYLIPVVGIIPALWTLSRRNGSKKQRSLSRLSVTITSVWIIAYCLLWLGSLQTSEVLMLRLLYLNGLVTTGYIVVCLGFIVQILRGKR